MLLSPDIDENPALRKFHLSLQSDLSLTAYEERLMKKLSNASYERPFVIPLVRLKRYGIVGSKVQRMNDMFREFRRARVYFSEGVDYSASSPEAFSIKALMRLLRAGPSLQCLYFCYGMQVAQSQVTQLTSTREKQIEDLQAQLQTLRDKCNESDEEQDVQTDELENQIQDLQDQVELLTEERDELLDKVEYQEEIEEKVTEMESNVQEAEERLEDANAVIDLRNDTIEEAGNVFREMAARRVCEVKDKRYEPRFAVMVKWFRKDDRLIRMHLRLVQGIAKNIDTKLSALLGDYELMLPPIFVPNPKMLIQRSMELCEARIQREINIWNQAIEQRVKFARQDYKNISREFSRSVGVTLKKRGSFKHSSTVLSRETSESGETKVMEVKVQTNANVEIFSQLRLIPEHNQKTSPRHASDDDLSETASVASTIPPNVDNLSETASEASTIPFAVYQENELTAKRIACRQELSKALQEERLTRKDVPITVNCKSIDWCENSFVSSGSIYECFVEVICDAQGGMISTDDPDLKIMMKRLKREFAADLEAPIESSILG